MAMKEKKEVERMEKKKKEKKITDEFWKKE